MTDTLVTIIIPVYNIAAYLPACLDSVLAQSYTDLEILLVDDGSSDETSEICAAYAKKDARIRFLRAEHKGVSHARNLALDQAHGALIAFADGDDLLPAESIALRVKGLGDADYLTSRHQTVDESLIVQKTHPAYQVTSCTKEEMIRNLYLQDRFGNQVFLWTKLYRATIIWEHHLQFDEDITIGEDRLFNLNYLCHCSTINLINDIAYLYRIRKGGAVSSRDEMPYTPAILTDLDAILRARPILQNESEEAHLATYRSAFYCTLKLYSRVPKENRSVRRYLKRVQTDNLFYYITHCGTLSPLKERFRMFLCWITNKRIVF